MNRPVTQTPFRIVCVEDEADILHDIVDELRDHGFLVEGALDGESALALIRSTEPDLVVCDMQLPGMSGLELQEALIARQAPIPSEFPSGSFHGQRCEPVWLYARPH